MMTKRLLVIIALILSANVFSQNTEEDVTALLDSSYRNFIEMDLLESVKIAEEARLLSIESDYSRGVTLSNIYIGKAFAEIGLHKESLKYLEDAQKESFYKNSVNAQAEIHRLLGRVYFKLGMYEIGIKEFRKQLNVSKDIEGSLNQKRVASWAHQNIAYAFSSQDVRDSVWYHLNKQKEILESLSIDLAEQGLFLDLSTVYADIGKEYVHKNEFEKAESYLGRSKKLLLDYESPYLFHTLEYFGDLEVVRNDKEKALIYYREALDNAKSLGAKEAEKNFNKLIADFMFKQEKKSDSVEAIAYLQRFQVLNDSLSVVNDRVIEEAYKQILNKKEKVVKSKYNTYIYILGFITIIAFSALLLYFLKHNRKEKELVEFSDELKIKQVKIDDLKEEVDNKKFNELIKLAKENDSRFLVLFEELYPDFIQKLKELDPNIRPAAQSFCALIYLNFSTKEIAEYTFVTVRAVQIRRNRLRKKFNINSDIDLYDWMRSL